MSWDREKHVGAGETIIPRTLEMAYIFVSTPVRLSWNRELQLRQVGSSGRLKQYLSSLACCNFGVLDEILKFRGCFKLKG